MICSPPRPPTQGTLTPSFGRRRLPRPTRLARHTLRGTSTSRKCWKIERIYKRRTFFLTPLLSFLLLSSPSSFLPPSSPSSPPFFSLLQSRETVVKRACIACHSCPLINYSNNGSYLSAATHHVDNGAPAPFPFAREFLLHKDLKWEQVVVDVGDPHMVKPLGVLFYPARPVLLEPFAYLWPDRPP